MKNKKTLTSRQLKALETKKILFETAIALFAEKGYDEVSVDEIVSKARTSKGTFYTYFDAKDRVLIEQFKRVDENHENIYNNFRKEQTATEKLLGFVKQTYTFVAKEMGEEIIKVVYISQIKYNSEKLYVTDESRALYRVVGKIIAEGRENGEFRNDISVGELTKMVIRCLRGTLYEWCLYDGNFDLVDDGQRFFSIFIKGILSV